MTQQLKVTEIRRSTHSKRIAVLVFNRNPTGEELLALHEKLRTIDPEGQLHGQISVVYAEPGNG